MKRLFRIFVASMIGYFYTYKNISITVLTVIISIGMNTLIEDDNVKTWEMVMACFAFAAVLLALHKQHGDVFTAIGFKLACTGVLLIIGRGIFDVGTESLNQNLSLSSSIMTIFGVLFVLFSQILFSWSLAEIFMESGMRTKFVNRRI